MSRWRDMAPMCAKARQNATARTRCVLDGKTRMDHTHKMHENKKAKIMDAIECLTLEGPGGGKRKASNLRLAGNLITLKKGSFLRAFRRSLSTAHSCRASSATQALKLGHMHARIHAHAHTHTHAHVLIHTHLCVHTEMTRETQLTRERGLAEGHG